MAIPIIVMRSCKLGAANMFTSPITPVNKESKNLFGHEFTKYNTQ